MLNKTEIGHLINQTIVAILLTDSFKKDKQGVKEVEEFFANLSKGFTDGIKERLEEELGKISKDPIYAIMLGINDEKASSLVKETTDEISSQMNTLKEICIKLINKTENAETGNAL